MTDRDDAMRRLAIIAGDSHKLMQQADEAIKGHTRNRAEAIIKLHQDYGADPNRVAELTGVPESTVRTVLFKYKTIGKGY